MMHFIKFCFLISILCITSKSYACFPGGMNSFEGELKYSQHIFTAKVLKHIDNNKVLVQVLEIYKGHAPEQLVLEVHASLPCMGKTTFTLPGIGSKFLHYSYHMHSGYAPINMKGERRGGYSNAQTAYHDELKLQSLKLRTSIPAFFARLGFFKSYASIYEARLYENNNDFARAEHIFQSLNNKYENSAAFQKAYLNFLIRKKTAYTSRNHGFRYRRKEQHYLTVDILKQTVSAFKASNFGTRQLLEHVFESLYSTNNIKILQDITIKDKKELKQKFSHIFLDKMAFRNNHLHNFTPYRAIFVNAEFSDNELQSPPKKNNEIRQSFFHKATFINNKIQNYSLNEVFFDHSLFKNSSINADMKHVIFSNTVFENIRFEGSNEKMAQFFINVDFSTAEFSNVTFKNVFYDCDTKWPKNFDPLNAGLTPIGYRCDGVNMQDAYKNKDYHMLNLKRVRIHKPDYSGSHFYKTRLPSFSGQAKFLNTRIEDSSFYMVDAYNTAFNYSNITNTNFTSAKLRRSHFESAFIHNNNFSFSELTDANFISVNLQNNNFRNAYLVGSKFLTRNSGFETNNFTGAKYSEQTIWPEGFDPVAAGAILVK